MQVNLVSDLINHVGSEPNEVITVPGYHNIDDGGGGIFYWDSASSEAPNYGTIFLTSTTGRWKRLFDDTINVKWFGAKGNGSDDDTNAIQNAVNVSNDILFPDGSYLVSHEILLTHDQQIRGSGNATLKRIVDGDIVFNLINANGCSLSVSGINFDGGLDVNKSYWKSEAEWNGRPYRCKVDKPSSFIRATDAAQLSVTNCNFSNIHGYCIFIASVLNVSIADSNFNNIEGDAAIQHWTSGMLRVNNCTFKEIGSLPESFFVDGVLQHFDQQNKYFTVYGDAIACFAGNLIVSGCYFKNIDRLSVAHDLNFEYNVIESQSVIEGNVMVYDSLRLRNSNPPGAIWCEQVKNANIANNKVQLLRRSLDEVADFRVIHFTTSEYDNCKVVVSSNSIEAEKFNSTLSAAITTGLLKSSSNVVIADNVIKGTFVNGILIGSSSQTQIDSSCSITGNTISLTGTTAAAVIRLDAANGNLPKSILINDNILFSSVDNGASTPYPSGSRMIHLGSIGSSFDPNITVSICGNNLNGGTFEGKGFRIGLLNVSNNSNLGGIEVNGGSPTTLTGVAIHGNHIIKNCILRYAAGSFIGNRCSDTVTISGAASLHVASNSFAKSNGPCIITDADVDFVRSAIVNNIFALYSNGATGIDMRFSGSGNYYGLHVVGNMFAGNSTPNTTGINYESASGRFFGVVADNRFSDLIVNERNRTLNTNV
jgi:hypothetical protein